MDTPSDRFVSSYFDDETRLLKARSSKALALGMAFGFIALISLACFAILIFLSALRLNPLGSRASILVGVLLVLLVFCFIPISWFFVGRFLYLRAQVMKHVQHSTANKNI